LVDVWSAGIVVFELLTRKRFWNVVLDSTKPNMESITNFLKERRCFDTKVFALLDNLTGAASCTLFAHSSSFPDVV
jgi:hypothetical protein